MTLPTPLPPQGSSLEPQAPPPPPRRAPSPSNNSDDEEYDSGLVGSQLLDDGPANVEDWIENNDDSEEGVDSDVASSSSAPATPVSASSSAARGASTFPVPPAPGQLHSGDQRLGHTPRRGPLIDRAEQLRRACSEKLGDLRFSQANRIVKQTPVRCVALRPNMTVAISRLISILPGACFAE